MRLTLVLPITLCLLCTHAFCQDEAPIKVGEIIFATDFEQADALDGWTGSATLDEGFESPRAMTLARPADSEIGSTISRIPLPLERVRGCLVHLSCMVRAQDVSEKPRPWNGIKFMAPIVTEGGTQHPQAGIGVGSFDWRRVVFPLRVPEEATDWSLYMGLESVTGKVWFDDIQVIVRKLPFAPKPRVTDGPPYRGHDLPRLRGAMVGRNIDEESLRVFGEEWNANVVRWQLVGWRPKGDSFDLDAYQAWLQEQLARLDAALPLCEKYGIYVVVDLHNAPCGGPDSGKDLFSSAECQDRFVENWEMMARRYRDSNVVWAYDLVNEPHERAVVEGALDWEGLAERAAKAIREIDPDHAIIVEPRVGGNPIGLVQFNPIDAPNVLYSAHMYLPHAFTHQGVYGNWEKKYAYPGEIAGKMWDKAQLELALKPAIDFQEQFGVHMYIGEFSAIRWAPDGSAYRYLRDCIEIFEEHGWDWTYHAFREWSGWSVEHGPDKDDGEPAAEPTQREKLLREWFSKNEKPNWFAR